MLLLACAPLLLAATPTSGEITLRIKDAQQRPVPNVSVTIEYISTDPLLGELHKIDIITSDNVGIVKHVITADYNTPYTMTITHNFARDVSAQTWLGSIDRFVNLPLSDFSIRVVDSDGNPLGRVPLRVVTDNGEFAFVTNSTGYKLFTQYNKELTYDIFAKYGAREFSVRVTPDSKLHMIQAATYALEVRTLNDQGRSVETQMALTYTTVESITRRTMGIAGLFTQIPEGNATLEITHGLQSIKQTFYINESITRTFTFDETPPVISTPWTIPIKPVPENEVQVLVNVTDTGSFAAGMPEAANGTSPVSINYSMTGSDWRTAKMFPRQAPENKTYMTRLPAFPPNTVVRYFIIAQDSAGNTVLSPQYLFNTVTNGTDNRPQPGIDVTQAVSQFMSQYWWVFPIILVLAAAYYVKKNFL